MGLIKTEGNHRDFGIIHKNGRERLNKEADSKGEELDVQGSLETRKLNINLLWKRIRERELRKTSGADRPITNKEKDSYCF